MKKFSLALKTITISHLKKNKSNFIAPIRTPNFSNDYHRGVSKKKDTVEIR